MQPLGLVGRGTAAITRRRRVINHFKKLDFAARRASHGSISNSRHGEHRETPGPKTILRCGSNVRGVLIVDPPKDF
jgi:hypothetical protein